jgi:hypothetical protein
LSARKHIMLVGRIASPPDRHAPFIESGLLVDLVSVGVQVDQIRRDLYSLGIEPRAVTDAVLGIDPARALGREIGVPRLAARTNGLSEALTMAVGAVEPAAFPDPGADAAPQIKNACLFR